jgi:PAS domain S-box-containing protein
VAEQRTEQEHLLAQLNALQARVKELEERDARHRSIEDELRASEERFRLAFDLAAVGRAMAGVDGRITKVNPSFCAITGYSEDEALAMTWQEIIHPDHLELNTRAAQRLLSGDSPSFEHELKVNHKHGDRLWVHLNVVLIRDNRGRPLFFLSDLVDITERRCAEQALRESEQKFRSLADKSPNMIFISKRGRVVYANDRCVEFLGYAKEEFYADGFDYLTLIAPESVNTVRAAYRAHSCGCDVPAYEYTLLRKDGTRVDAILNSKVIEYGGETAILGIATDITARKCTERALRESEERFRSIFENAPIGLGVADAGGNIRSFNEAMLVPGGYEVADIGRIGNVANLYYDAAERDEVLRIAREQGCVHRHAVRFKRKDGTPYHALLSLVPANVGGEPGWQALVEDITERKRAQEELIKLEREKRLILDSTAELIAFQTPDYRVAWANRACGESVDADPQDLIGRQCHEIWHQSDEPCPHCPITKVYQTGHSHEEEISSPDGRWWLIRGSPVHDDDGTLLGAVEVTLDITERKRMEQELSRAKRLEAAGQFAGQIAHDFNNLLGPLVAYPDLIRSKIGSDGRLAEMLADMEEAARQIADINQQLLTLGRRGHYKTVQIRLDELVEQTLRAIPISETIEVRTDWPGDLLPIRGGRAQLARVLTNIITNAVEAMNKAGTLTLAAANACLDAPLQHYTSVATGEYVRLDITDTGGGIKPEIIDRVFDPFFTTKTTDRRRGSGLGLTVARTVVEDHKGYICLQSGLGDGSTVSLFFPVDRNDDTAETAPQELPRGNGETVLVVDDDPLQLRIAERTLTHLNYRVKTAKSGESAVEYVKDHPQDILLVDMVMKGIDGVETLRRIRALYPNQRSIIFSGFAANKKVEQACALGALEFLPKPFSLAALAEAVHRVAAATVAATGEPNA